jgi:hypothetical protein
MMNFLLMVLVLVIISTVVGAIAKMINNLAESNVNRRVERDRQERAERQANRAERAERPPPEARPRAAAAPAGGAPRQGNSDMDRFLAEIDRLRRKAAAEQPQQTSASAQPVAPVVQPAKPSPDKPKPRVVAELADPAAAAFTAPHAPARPTAVAAQIEDLPVAAVLKATATTGAPAATKVTRFHNRPRPASRTNFGKNLTALLGSGQGVAMAIVLQEILGPPAAKKNAGHV